MIKWKGALFFIVLALIVAIISVGLWLIVGVASDMQDDPRKNYEVIGFSAVKNYIGTTSVMESGSKTRSFDILEALGLDNTYTVSSSNPSVILGSVATFSAGTSYSDMVITISKDGESTEYYVVDGVNIYRAQDIFSLVLGDIEGQNIFINDDIVLQRDIEMKDIYNKYPRFSESVKTFIFEHNFYGNGHKVSADGLYTNADNMTFRFEGMGISLLDTIFSGCNVDNDVDLNSLYDTGVLCAFGFKNKKSTINVENCIFQNAKRDAYVKNSDITFKGCLFNNSAISNLSVEVLNEKSSTVTLENCALANAVVSNVLVFSESEVDESKYCTINLKGFVDFYGWKERSKVKFLSDREDNAKIYNTFLQQVFNSVEVKDEMVEYDDSYYMNFGIVAISTGGKQNAHKLTVNGGEDVGVAKANLPVNAIVSQILSTYDVYGYKTIKNISPIDTPSDNKYLYYELRNGRVI